MLLSSTNTEREVENAFVKNGQQATKKTIMNFNELTLRLAMKTGEGRGPGQKE